MRLYQMHTAFVPPALNVLFDSDHLTSHAVWSNCVRAEQVLSKHLTGGHPSKYWQSETLLHLSNLPPAGYDEYSLLYSTRDFFSLLVPYSEILLLGRVASNGNALQWKHQRFKIGCWQHTCNIFLCHLDIIHFLKWKIWLRTHCLCIFGEKNRRSQSQISGKIVI